MTDPTTPTPGTPASIRSRFEALIADVEAIPGEITDEVRQHAIVRLRNARLAGRELGAANNANAATAASRSDHPTWPHSAPARPR